MRLGTFWRRAILIALIPALLLGLWKAIHRVRWLGPLLADTGRVVLGNRAVAQLEDIAYGVQDRYHIAARAGERPQAYWDVPASTTRPVEAIPAAVAEGGRAARVFRPADVPPMHASWSAPGDGVWVAVEDPRHADPPRLYKTLLHPDKNRS